MVVASGGNAGLAHAYTAGTLGVRATVFVPETAPPGKIQRIREYGADVRQAGAEYAEANEAAIDYANTRGALFCHAYDQPEIAAGAGTLAEEILDMLITSSFPSPVTVGWTSSGWWFNRAKQGEVVLVVRDESGGEHLSVVVDGPRGIENFRFRENEVDPPSRARPILDLSAILLWRVAMREVNAISIRVFPGGEGPPSRRFPTIECLRLGPATGRIELPSHDADIDLRKARVHEGRRALGPVQASHGSSFDRSEVIRG